MVPVNGDWSVGLKMGGSTDEPLVSSLEYNSGPVDVGNPTGLVGEAVATVGLGLHPNNCKRRYNRNCSKRVHAKRQAMKKKKWIEKQHGRIAIINPYIPRDLWAGNEKKKITCSH